MYVVSVPVIVNGKNARGKVQSRTTELPVDMLGIGRIPQNNSDTPERRIARVKSHVLQQLAIRTQGGATILMEISGETFSYDRDGEWLISELTTKVEDGEAVKGEEAPHKETFPSQGADGLVGWRGLR